LEVTLRADRGDVLVETQIRRNEYSENPYSVTDIDSVVPKSQF